VVKVRRSRGKDIDAAGQLANKEEKKWSSILNSILVLDLIKINFLKLLVLPFRHQLLTLQDYHIRHCHIQ
jgi:hypothetical protein